MTINRRYVLAHGGKAIAAAAMLPFLPSITHAKEDKEDAELFALYEKYKRLERLEIAAEEWEAEARIAVRRAYQNKPLPNGANKKWDANWAEAEKRAGVTDLGKKRVVAVKASCEVLSRLYNMRANTSEGVLLKLVIRRSATAASTLAIKARVPSLLRHKEPVEMDIERLLSARRI